MQTEEAIVKNLEGAMTKDKNTGNVEIAKQGEMAQNKTYTHDEAVRASVTYFKGDELAATVWVNKYALKDSFGKLYELTPDDMHHRIASELARIEKRYAYPLSETEIYELLKDFSYVAPQGSPMAGIGNNYQVASLSNCFV